MVYIFTYTLANNKQIRIISLSCSSANKTLFRLYPQADVKHLAITIRIKFPQLSSIS